jgi:hypothetical protein
MMATRFLSSTLKRLSANSRETPDSETAGNAELLEDPSRDEEAFGLFRLYASGSMMDPISELATRSAGPSETVAPYDVDIVAIHGLGGTAYKTWTHDNGRLWLRDFAPIQFPGARIYTFGYDSGIAFSRGTGTVGDFAKILLESIKLERQTPDVGATSSYNEHVDGYI